MGNTLETLLRWLGAFGSLFRVGNGRRRGMRTCELVGLGQQMVPILEPWLKVKRQLARYRRSSCVAVQIRQVSIIVKPNWYRE